MTTIEVDLNNIALDEITSVIQRALHQTGDFIVGDAIQKQVIPFNNGTLQNNRVIYSDANNVYIQHNTPYARRIYYGDKFNFQTTNNKNAQSRFYRFYENNGEDYDRVQAFFIDRIRIEGRKWIE
jgi:hypothetical protein